MLWFRRAGNKRVFPRSGTRFALMIAVVTVTLIGACKSSDIPGSWVDSPITVDGKTNDWKTVPTYLFEDENATIGICNDSTYLYLMLRLSELRRAMMIRREGLTIWLDTGGGEEANFMIKFRGGPSMSEMRPQGDSTGRGDRGSFPGMMPSDTKNREPQEPFTCYIKNRIAENGIAEDGSNGPAAAFAVESGVVTYEFSVPLDSARVLYYGLGTTPGTKIGVGAVWQEPKEMDKREFGGMPMGGGGRGGGGGFPGGGGGMPPAGGGGRGGPPGGERSDFGQEMNVWFKMTLATPEISASQPAATGN